MKKETLHVEGMSCNHCVKAIEGALEKIRANGSVDLTNKQVTVEYDESIVTLEQIKEAIEDQGYDIV